MSENHTEKKKLLLVGGGGLGRVVSEWATRDYECAFVDDGIPVGTEVCNVPVIGQIPDLPELRKTYDTLFLLGEGHTGFCYLNGRCFVSI